MWGVLVALFGVRFTSQFGEKPDMSGEWAKTLKGVSRRQVVEGMERVRMSGRDWPPTAPEFRALCLMSVRTVSSLEVAYAELCKFVAEGRSDTHNLSAGLYHTLKNHLSLYTWRQLPTDKGLDVFRAAYKATLEHERTGQELSTPPDAATLLENAPTPKTQAELDADRVTAEAAREKLKAMFPPKKPVVVAELTEAERKDLERLERLKSQVGFGTFVIPSGGESCE